MPRRYMPGEVTRVLVHLGWVYDHQTGSHAIFQRPGYQTISVPQYRRELPPKTLGSILRQMGMTKAEFDRIASEVL